MCNSQTASHEKFNTKSLFYNNAIQMFKGTMMTLLLSNFTCIFYGLFSLKRHIFTYIHTVEYIKTMEVETLMRIFIQKDMKI